MLHPRIASGFEIPLHTLSRARQCWVSLIVGWRYIPTPVYHPVLYFAHLLLHPFPNPKSFLDASLLYRVYRISMNRGGYILCRLLARTRGWLCAHGLGDLDFFPLLLFQTMYDGSNLFLFMHSFIIVNVESIPMLKAFDCEVAKLVFTKRIQTSRNRIPSPSWWITNRNS